MRTMGRGPTLEVTRFVMLGLEVRERVGLVAMARGERSGIANPSKYAVIVASIASQEQVGRQMYAFALEREVALLQVHSHPVTSKWV